jgi:hypothetical protein
MSATDIVSSDSTLVKEYGATLVEAASWSNDINKHEILDVIISSSSRTL